MDMAVVIMQSMLHILTLIAVTVGAAIDAMFAQDFRTRLLPFDVPETVAFAAICASRIRSRRPISQFNAQIAAIAHSRGAWLAAWKTSDYDACDIQIIDPWQS